MSSAACASGNMAYASLTGFCARFTMSIPNSSPLFNRSISVSFDHPASSNRRASLHSIVTPGTPIRSPRSLLPLSGKRSTFSHQLRRNPRHADSHVVPLTFDLLTTNGVRNRYSLGHHCAAHDVTQVFVRPVAREVRVSMNDEMVDVVPNVNVAPVVVTVLLCTLRKYPRHSELCRTVNEVHPVRNA